VEPEFARMLRLEGVALYCTRIASAPEVTEETLTAMAARLPDAARSFPTHARLDAVGYACTSASTYIGAERVAALVRGARPEDSPGSLAGAAVTDPLTAVKAACAALSVRRIGMVTPYVEDVSAAMRASLEGDGLQIAGFGSFGSKEERVVARISPGSVLEAILDVGRAQPCEAVFASCTNLRTLDAIAPAERELGVPVVSSNQALAWHMLRSCGVEDRIEGFGRLLAL